MAAAGACAATGGLSAATPSVLLNRRPRFERLGLAIACDPSERAATLARTLALTEDWWLTHSIPKEGLTTPSSSGHGGAKVQDAAKEGVKTERPPAVRMRVHLGGC
mmetsp:Transcript_52495/g.147368  ORF Transcript_52495/g.147368 Transcript_52495/m.147368 type:complete len:106 (+) Transcript_52495:104-421(+)